MTDDEVRETLEEQQPVTKEQADQLIEKRFERWKEYFRAQLETERHAEQLATSTEKLKRWDEYNKRAMCGMIGFAIGMTFFLSLAQCQELNHRVSALEQKK